MMMAEVRKSFDDHIADTGKKVFIERLEAWELAQKENDDRWMDLLESEAIDWNDEKLNSELERTETTLEILKDEYTRRNKTAEDIAEDIRDMKADNEYEYRKSIGEA